MESLLSVANSILERSQFYQSFHGSSYFQSFEEIALSSKSDLLEDQIQFPPFGSNLCVGIEKIKRIHRTSGTTSTPYLIALTEKDIEAVHLSGSQAFKVAGVNNSDIVINCMNYNMWMGGLSDHLSLERAGAAVIPFGVGRTNELIELALRLNGCSIHSTPSYMSAIKERLERDFKGVSPKDLKFKKGLFGGEPGMQSQEFRQKIKEVWGLDPIDANYGLSDAISIMGSECSAKKGLHFSASRFLHVELVDANFKSVELNKDTIGELVVTTLSKEAQPLIRYKTGDVLRITGTGICECGVDSFRFQLVGRSDDMLIVKGVNFYPESIRSIISSWPGLTGNYQVWAEKEEPISSLEIVVEKDIDIELKSLADLSEKISENFQVKSLIKATVHLKLSGNKVKVLNRGKYENSN